MDSSQHADAPKPNRPFPTSPEPAGAELPWPPPLFVAGDPPPGRPRPIRDHPKVRPDPLSLFPLFPLAAGDSPRRKSQRRRSSVLSFPSRDPRLKEMKLSGVQMKSCKSTQNSKLQKFLENRIKIRKMQTKMFWNP